jgi:hypothetical protein
MDEDCPSSFPFCRKVDKTSLFDESLWYQGLRACFQCTEDDTSLCGSITPVCRNGLCAQCQTDGDCSSRYPSNPVCNGGICAQCTYQPPDTTEPYNFFETSSCRQISSQIPTCGPGTALIDYINYGNCVQCVTTSLETAQVEPVNNCPAKQPHCTDTETYVVSPVCAQCGSSAQCLSKSTKICNATSLTCTGCLTNDDCGDTQICTNGVCTTCTLTDTSKCSSASPYCVVDPVNAAASQCAQCTDNGQCTSPQPKCHSATKTCRECEVNTDCGSGVCKDGSCVECTDNTTCTSAENPVCDTETNICRPCIDSAPVNSCLSTNGLGYFCKNTTCVPGCNTDADCPASAPICTENQCKACTQDNTAQCSGSVPVCNTKGICTGCLTDQDCTSVDPNTVTPVCKVTVTPESGAIGRCVSCETNSDCPDPNNPVCCGDRCRSCCTNSDCSDPKNPLCETSVGSCVACLTNGDCDVSGSSQNKYCSNDLTCVGCTADSQCPTGVQCIGNQCNIICSGDNDCTDPALPHCDTTIPGGKCVQCRSSLGNVDCTNSITPVCGNAEEDPTFDQCVGCLSDVDCLNHPTNKICDLRPGSGTANTCIGCALDSDCDGDPNNSVCCAENTCCPCEDDGPCLASDMICDTDKRVCTPCLNDANCVALNPSNPICLNSQRCVQCINQIDCDTPGTYCDTSTNQCVPGCFSDPDCADAAPDRTKCKTDVHECVACLSNADCSAQSPFCELSNPARLNQCVGCLTTSDCIAGTVCSEGICTPCLSDPDCAGKSGGPHCQIDQTTPEKNACVPCLINEHCGAGQVCKLDPDNGNSCVSCLDSNDCPNGVCDLTSNRCQPCLSDGTGCKDPTPVCDTSGTSHVCKQCVSQGDCENPSPFCDLSTNQCVTCRNDGDCPTSNPACISVPGGRTCVQCSATNTAACGSNQFCLESKYRCVSCRDSNDCAGNGANIKCNQELHTCVPECYRDRDCPASSPICFENRCVSNKVGQQTVIQGVGTGRYSCGQIPFLWAAATGERFPGGCQIQGNGCCHCPACGRSIGCPWASCGKGSVFRQPGLLG